MHFCNRQCADTRRQPLVGKDWRRVGGYRGRQGWNEEHPNLWNMQMRMAPSAMRSQSYCLAARGRPKQCEWRKETHDAIFLPMCQGWPHLFLRCCRQLLCGERVKRARCWKGNVSVKLHQDIARGLSHKGVMVEGRPALLRQSYMDCCRGGRIVIILNEKKPLRRQPTFLLATPMRFGGRWAIKLGVQEAICKIFLFVETVSTFVISIIVRSLLSFRCPT